MIIVAVTSLVAISAAGMPRTRPQTSRIDAHVAQCPMPVPSDVEIWGFTGPWDPRSDTSVRCDARALRAVISGWVRLDSMTGIPTAVYPDTIHVPRGPRHFALVTTYERDRFHPETVTRLSADPALRGRVAGMLATFAQEHHYQGLVLDFEGLTKDDTTALATVVRAIVDSAHRHQVNPVAVTLVPTDTVVYAIRHMAAADLFVAMLYDEHWATGTPGPIASPAWVRQALALRVAEVGANRLVAGFPAYGYLWKHAAPTAILSFSDAQRHAARSGIPLTRDSASGTLHYVAPDSSQLWIADAGLTRMLVSVAESLGVHRFALWRLGLEDPAIWSAFRGLPEARK
jgi:peptidoglycan-N-acetylglucosamine deacetylase